MMDNMIPTGRVESKILQIRGQKVILDSDLAELYGVETKVFNQAIKRNIGRFPERFMFQLTEREFEHLRSQFVTSKFSKRRYLPYVFTEHGTIMAANILNSQRAINVSVLVVDAFVRMRQMITSNIKIASEISELERRLDTHDEIIVDIVQSVKHLLDPATNTKKKKQIGFLTEREEDQPQSG